MARFYYNLVKYNKPEYDIIIEVVDYTEAEANKKAEAKRVEMGYDMFILMSVEELS